MKSCSKCLRRLCLESFYPDPRAVDGHRSDCKDCHKSQKNSYYARKKTEIRESKRRAYSINPAESIERARKRKVKIKFAIPKWLTPEQRNQINEFYKNCPEGYEVDHIEPLQGTDVSGLHVPWNLQYLTISENRRKGNRRAA